MNIKTVVYQNNKKVIKLIKNNNKKKKSIEFCFLYSVSKNKYLLYCGIDEVKKIKVHLIFFCKRGNKGYNYSFSSFFPPEGGRK